MHLGDTTHYALSFLVMQKSAVQVTLLKAKIFAFMCMFVYLLDARCQAQGELSYS